MKKISLVVLALLSLSSKSMAHIHTTAFKGITRLMKKEQYSPTLGAIALSNLVPDLRLYGNFESTYDSQGNREYIKDTSKDPLLDIVKILFPSPAGVLSLETTGMTNFAKYVDKPQVVSELINFAFKIRQDLEARSQKEKVISPPQKQIQSVEEVKQTTNVEEEVRKIKSKITSLTKGQKTISSETKGKIQELNKQLQALQPKAPKKSQQKTTPEDYISSYTQTIQNLLSPSASHLESEKIKDLLKAIKESIENELHLQNLYPKGTTEQILLAFFVHKFNSQEDIKTLLQGYDPELVDHEELKKAHFTPFTWEDLTELQEQDPHILYGLDDVYDLMNHHIFTSALPYNENQPLLNNGLAKKYIRKTNEILMKDEPIADCVETTIRHILNLTFYNAQEENFSSINPTLNPMENVRPFFQRQTVEQASWGDLAYRSAFNTLVADLNMEKSENAIPIKYKKEDNNELKAGLLNLIRTLSRVLGIEIQEDQTDPSDPQQWVQAKGEWIQKTLEDLLNQSTQDKTHNVTLNNIQAVEWKKHQDLIGQVHVQVSDSLGKDLYRFDILTKETHMEIENLKSLTPKKINLDETLRTHNTLTLNGSSRDSLWTLLPQIKYFQNIPLLHQLLAYPIVDNYSRIHFVKTLLEHFKDDVVQKNMDSLKGMLKHMLKGFSWGDFTVVKLISPHLLGFLDKDQHFFKEGLGKEIKALHITDEEKLTTLSTITGLQLQHLSCSLQENVETFSLEKFKSLIEQVKTLRLNTSQFKNITGLKDLKNLEELNLFDVRNLQSFDATGLKNLKSLVLGGTSITNITGLKDLKNLEELCLDTTKNFQNFDGAELENLKTLSLIQSNVKILTGLPKKLEDLDISKTENLQELDLREVFQPIKINATGSSIKTLVAGRNLLENVGIQCEHDITVKYKGKDRPKLTLYGGNIKYEEEME